MPIIDQRVTWRLAEERLERETDPVLRRNLESLIQHQRAEATRDIEPLMATVSERAHYHFYDDPSGASDLIGKDAVRDFYERFAASGAHKLQLDTDRLVVDRHCILTEGAMRIAYPGRALLARGIDIDDPEAHYLFEARMAIMWPIDEDGLFLAEDSYTSGDGFAGIAGRKLDPAEIFVLPGA
jgi:hypothetical protein